MRTPDSSTAETQWSAETAPAAGRKTLSLAWAAVGFALVLAGGVGMWQVTEAWEAEKRRPDRIEVLAAQWVPGQKETLRLKVRLSRADGRAFDPYSGVAVRSWDVPGSQIHYVRGWRPGARPLPARALEAEFPYTIPGADRPPGPRKILFEGWSRPRLFRGWQAWVARIPGAVAIPGLLRPPARLVLIPYALEGSEYSVAPPERLIRSPSGGPPE